MEFLDELLAKRKFVGKVEWIGIAVAGKAKMLVPESVELLAGKGIVGEHHFRENGGSNRQVTLIQYEHLPVIAAFLGRSDVSPLDLRRNILVSGINLASLKDVAFRIGDVGLKGTGKCPPCSRMETTLEPGGYAAMLGHGGITAVVETGGRICVGDSVVMQ